MVTVGDEVHSTGLVDAIPPATQQFMAHRAGSVINEVAACHVPMISQPKATLATSMQAVHAVD